MSESDTKADMLRDVFALQSQLNDYVFKSNGIVEAGNQLTMEGIANAAQQGKLGANDLPNQWLLRYASAMDAEIVELKEDLHWKWWVKDQIDLQNIRVELVDILHFLVSAMIASGLTADDVHGLYLKKHAVNVQRQNQNYTSKSKTEDDNRTVR